MRQLDLPNGYIKFDENEIELHLENSKSNQKIINALSFLTPGTQYTHEINRKIRLELVDTVQVNWLSETDPATKAMLRLGGMKKEDFTVGTLSIATSVSGGGIQLPISEKNRANAIEFVDELKHLTKDRGRKVEIVGGSTATQTSEDTKVCPDCAEDIKMAARKCRYCGFEFSL